MSRCARFRQRVECVFSVSWSITNVCQTQIEPGLCKSVLFFEPVWLDVIFTRDVKYFTSHLSVKVFYESFVSNGKPTKVAT